MEETSKIRIKFEIGDIKFEAEGTAELVERERSFFTDNLLPSAIDAIVRTRDTRTANNSTDYSYAPGALPMDIPKSIESGDDISTGLGANLERVSLASFAKSKGAVEHYDFILCAAYFNEKRNHVKTFSSSSLKELYSDAKRPEPKNLSMSLSELAKKGLIMEDSASKGTTPKEYVLTIDGESAVENMQPKEHTPRTDRTKTRKSRTKEKSKYSSLDCDELNLGAHPEIKELGSFKEKMLLAVYVITNEGKGEWFTVDDVLCIMTDLLGESATRKQVEGVFSREKRWFKSERIDENNKVVHRKLLNEGKAFAESLNTNKS